MLQGLTGWHFLIILVIILLLFGAPKLPALARSLGQSMKILKSETRSEKDDAPAEGSDTVADEKPKPGADSSTPSA
ncbi:MAG: twin-arginine translocase TatA/TatE family subunit [Actinomycetota bacterium]|jgi:sec-independent protein translocase protein TatA|nr:twin-arginine translocase TatA/TatE family subunit [Actinomycetota bacterium]